MQLASSNEWPASIELARAGRLIESRVGGIPVDVQVPRPNLLSHLNTWLLCFILLVLASTYGFSFERGNENTVGASKDQGVSSSDAKEAAIIRIQNEGAYLLCALLMLPLIGSIGVEFRRNILISSLLLWAFASCVWSHDPGASIINGLRMALSVALAFYLFKRYAPNDLLKLMLLVGSMAAASSIVLILVFPKFGLQGRDLMYGLGAWQGIFGQKNICGRMMTLLLLPAFFVQLEGRWWRPLRFAYVVVLLIIIGMTRSTGSWVLCGASLLFIASLRLAAKLRRIDAMGLGMIVFGIAAVVIVAVVANADALLWMIGKDPTMTGRTVIWSSLMISVLKHPFIGYGYMAFWQGLNGESANAIMQLNWPGMGYAENGVLELWLELGGIAVALYALVFLVAVKDAVYCLRRNPSSSTMWYISILFYVVIANLWAGNLLTPSTLECVLPFVAYAGLRGASRRIRGLQTA